MPKPEGEQLWVWLDIQSRSFQLQGYGSVPDLPETMKIQETKKKGAELDGTTFSQNNSPRACLQYGSFTLHCSPSIRNSGFREQRHYGSSAPTGSPY
jgi:hypothetical protein